MNIQYVLCFLQQEDKLLLIHRNKDPFKGKWNGIGGKIEANESPHDAALREIREESGLNAESLQFRGVMTWNQLGGLYLYVATEFSGEVLQSTEEGELAWTHLDWILTSPEVVPSVRYFLPHVLSDEPPVEHAITYSSGEYAGQITHYEARPLQIPAT